MKKYITLFFLVFGIHLTASANEINVYVWTEYIPDNIIEKFTEDTKSGVVKKNYKHTKKFLSVDTPENRFIKNVVSVTKNRLSDFHKKLIKLH